MSKKNKKKWNKLFNEFNSYTQFSLIGESEILNRFTRLGLQCYLPYGDLEQCDMVVSFKGNLKRIQIKSVYSIRNGVIKIDIRSHNETQSYKYNSDKIDFIAVFSYELDRAYLIPISDIENQTECCLRVVPTRNNQVSGIKWADDYILEKVANELLN